MKRKGQYAYKNAHRPKREIVAIMPNFINGV